jgi:hypothetical protein
MSDYSSIGVLPKTDHVDMSEDAYVLYEIDHKTPNSKAFHRYRVVHVVRNDGLAEFEWDMGDRANFKVEGFCIPGGGFNQQHKTVVLANQRPQQVPAGKKSYWFEETVGSLIDAAEGIHKNPFDTSEILENQTDLISGYHEQIDRKQNRNKRQFAIGGN